MLEHPLSSDHIRADWSINQPPGSISLKSIIAARQFGSVSAARADLGIGEMDASGFEAAARAYRGLGLTMPALRRVCIG
jgi:hypothetical protein